jgi:hypothetical protein
MRLVLINFDLYPPALPHYLWLKAEMYGSRLLELLLDGEERSLPAEESLKADL